ncbi:MAG: polysaccharide biosynthesis/export family protein [Planctomyces sp.]|nr:polysaccharide biosynthesis/export family protein [Planctomyces sp.]
MQVTRNFLKRRTRVGAARLGVLAMLAWCGCSLHTADVQMVDIGHAPVPRELDKMTLPEYRVEPPDILLIQAVQNIRPIEKPLRSGDELLIRLQNGLPLEVDAEPNSLDYQAQLQAEMQFKFVNGAFYVGPDGAIDLGPAYGRVSVAGRTLDEARTVIEDYLKDQIGLLNPVISVQFASLAGRQPIDGQHLVRPDGTLGLGIYGNVFVAGLTLDEVQQAIEIHLAQYMDEPEISVDVLAYNSKVIYIIMDGGGFGETVVRVPYTGNETVLDAMAQVNGLSQVSSKKVWIARPAPANVHRTQILDVHWSAITAEGITTTNYQLMPGDRIYVQADKLIATDNFLSKVFAPVERVFGIILLGRITQRGGTNNNN